MYLKDKRKAACAAYLYIKLRVSFRNSQAVVLSSVLAVLLLGFSVSKASATFCLISSGVIGVEING